MYVFEKLLVPGCSCNFLQFFSIHDIYISFAMYFVCRILTSFNKSTGVSLHLCWQITPVLFEPSSQKILQISHHLLPFFLQVLSDDAS